MWFLNPWSVIWQHGKWAKEECGITKSNLKVSLLLLLQSAATPSLDCRELMQARLAG